MFPYRLVKLLQKDQDAATSMKLVVTKSSLSATTTWDESAEMFKYQTGYLIAFALISNPTKADFTCHPPRPDYRAVKEQDCKKVGQNALWYFWYRVRVLFGDIFRMLNTQQYLNKQRVYLIQIETN